jgi:hypothetical protein
MWISESSEPQRNGLCNNEYVKRSNMEMNWSEMDVDALRDFYEKESAQLKASLLNGCSWEEMKDQRQKVTELAIALHKKMHVSGNPAESMDRSEKRINR